MNDPEIDEPDENKTNDQDESDTAELPDDRGLAGMAVTWTDTDGESYPAIIRGTKEEPFENVRVILDVGGREGLVDTDSSRVEVEET